MKNLRHGQAALLTDLECTKIRKQLKNPHRLIWDIARWTGERWGAVLQLHVSDVFLSSGQPRAEITFRARTRKASPDGRRATRQVPIHPVLHEILLAHKPCQEGYLFPSPRDGFKPLTLRAADAALRIAVDAAGLAHKGISSHSTRVSFITNLHSRGISLRTIQQLTGHKDLKVLSGYVLVSADQAKQAIAVL